MTWLLLRQGREPRAERDRPDGSRPVRRFSFWPTLTINGPQSKGLRGCSAEPLHPDAIGLLEISEAAVLAGRPRS